MSKNNAEKIVKELEKEDRKELEDLHNQLEAENARQKDPNTPIKNISLKRKVAQCCLRLMEETFTDYEPIEKTCYLLTGYFIGYIYGDKLDELIGTIGELELPKNQVQGDVLQKWGKVKKGLKQYLSKEE